MKTISPLQTNRNRAEISANADARPLETTKADVRVADACLSEFEGRFTFKLHAGSWWLEC